jgi:hypothetical protein
VDVGRTAFVRLFLDVYIFVVSSLDIINIFSFLVSPSHFLTLQHTLVSNPM